LTAPEQQTFAQRIVLTTVIVIAVLLILAIIGWALGPDEAQGQAREQSIEPSLMLTLPPTKWDAKLLELDRQALDAAYVKKVEQLFDVFVREGLSTDEGIMKGHAQAQRAYLKGQRAIEIKEKILEERAREQNK